MAFVEKIKDAVNRYIDAAALHDLDYKVKLVMREREELQGWSDKELRLATLAFKDDLKKGKRLESLLVPAFAVVNEVARRIYKQSPYPVQILGGLVIHQGKVAEMKAGEGKTLTETMPVYLNALEGKGVHLITTNDYLAERDAAWAGKLYDFLGLSVGYVTSTRERSDRRKAYACDITYVTNQEIGFDYLRDNLVYTRSERALRNDHPLHFGIVDEIDSILIDESRTPLIIAEPVKEQMEYYEVFTKLVSQLQEDVDYTVDYKDKHVAMTAEGLNKTEKILGGKLFSAENPMYVFYLDVCLKAKVIFERDRDYIISQEGVEIVDEFTGRVLPGRRFTDGVHQAIEAKEGVKVKDADRTLAAITFQNFFPMYEKLSGMSGTVMHSRDEFNRVYKLDVIQIPTNKPISRIDHNDLFFKTQKGKLLGLVKKVKQINKRGQPLLIGARNVEMAHSLAEILNEEGLPYQMLTAADHRAEADKIAKAGQQGMITIATNMAGRGTDILLGPGMEKTGGLFVLGSERHESRRIDDQLIGRSGRQGEPGESQFVISMEDEIMQLFGSERIIDAMEQFDIPEDEYISGKTLDEAFKKAQDFIESKNFDSRIYLYKYDSITNFQRRTLYKMRDDLLENEPALMSFMEQSLRDVVEHVFSLREARLAREEFRKIFLLDIPESQLREVMVFLDSAKKTDKGHHYSDIKEKFISFLWSKAMHIKAEPEIFEASKSLILQIIDEKWSGHLEVVDVLKEESGLLSYASQDPLIEFVLESKKLFTDMQYEIKKQFFSSLFTHLYNAKHLE